MTKVKKVSAKKATSSQKTAKSEARMHSKQTFVTPKLQEKYLISKEVARVKTGKSVAAKSAAPKMSDGHSSKESIFPAEFFVVMDELDSDAKKRRVAAYKVMKKAAAK